MGDIIFTIDNYSIYQNKGYYVCISNFEVNKYQMFIGFSDKRNPFVRSKGKGYLNKMP